MQQKRQKALVVYRIVDYLTALLSWIAFYLFRKYIEQGYLDSQIIINDWNFYLGMLLVPIFWIFLYHIVDKYKDIYRYSRLSTLINTLILTFLGSIAIMFGLLLDDLVLNYISITKSFFVLFALHFVLTSLGRMILLTKASRSLKSGEMYYNTMIIGGDDSAVNIYQELTNNEFSLGHKFIGFVDSNGKKEMALQNHLPRLGKIKDLSKIVEDHQIEEVIIAIETSEHNKLKKILNELYKYHNQLLVKIIPDMYDILLGTVKMNHLYGAVLIEVEQDLMPQWQWFLKRTIDILGSLIFIILLTPLYLFSMFKVKTSSPGPIFYKQQRIGKNGKPFEIIKFRSMVVNAEDSGPQLSSEDDPRITSWGKIMRKYRIDETPQFFNVLRGDMSLVGPRPERQYYIDKIMEQAPYYQLLLRVRPGITSWGQVKYGYASTVEQMLARLKFDILYIENMSIALDIKILFYTFLVLVKGKGK